MQQFFLIVFLIISAPAVFAQGGNGVWTSPGYGTMNAGGASTGSAGSAGAIGVTQQKNNQPAVSAVDVVYSDTYQMELLKISGSNFSPYKEKMRVTIDGAQPRVLRSDPKLITAVLPSGLGNTVLLSVQMNGEMILKDKKIKLPPRVTRLNLLSGPPGMPLTIYGSRFARKLEDNHIYIGGMEAHVDGGSRTALMTSIPAGLAPQSPTWGLSVVVKVGDLSSNSDVTIRIQNRVY